MTASSGISFLTRIIPRESELPAVHRLAHELGEISEHSVVLPTGEPTVCSVFSYLSTSWGYLMNASVNPGVRKAMSMLLSVDADHELWGFADQDFKIAYPRWTDGLASFAFLFADLYLCESSSSIHLIKHIAGDKTSPLVNQCTTSSLSLDGPPLHQGDVRSMRSGVLSGISEEYPIGQGGREPSIQSEASSSSNVPSSSLDSTRIT